MRAGVVGTRALTWQTYCPSWPSPLVPNQSSSVTATTGGVVAVAAAAAEEVEEAAAPHPAEKEGAEGEAFREPLPSGGAAVEGDACSDALPLLFTPPPAIVTFPMEVDRDGDVPDR